MLLQQGFWKSKLIASGDVIENNNPEIDLVGLFLKGGSMLPLVGQYMSGISLMYYAINLGVERNAKETMRSRSNRISDFFVNPLDISEVCSNFSNLISIVHSQQIQQLDVNGCNAFANYLTFLIFAYIAEDGKSKIIKWMENGYDFIRNQIRNFNPKFFPLTESSYLDPELKMLQAILSYVPQEKAVTKVSVNRKENEKVEGQEFYLECILRTSILTDENEIYCHYDSNNERYGFRHLTTELIPEGYRLEKKHFEEKQNSCIIL